MLSASLGNNSLLSNTCSPVSYSRCSPAPLPKMAGNGEGIHTHAHGFRRNGTKLLPVWTVFVDGLHLSGADCPWAHASQSHELLRVRVHGVNTPELAAGITEEDEEVIGRTLFHLLRFEDRKSKTKERITYFHFSIEMHVQFQKRWWMIIYLFYWEGSKVKLPQLSCFFVSHWLFQRGSSGREHCEWWIC